MKLSYIVNQVNQLNQLRNKNVIKYKLRLDRFIN